MALLLKVVRDFSPTRFLSAPGLVWAEAAFFATRKVRGTTDLNVPIFGFTDASLRVGGDTFLPSTGLVWVEAAFFATR
eukprot:CAMPEP_0196578350 /NCGR_PEP_ID=MMETSP1081-20130531/7262_1 /TAXON_ID=36882 /ORGANISM="Pyramimonas amylifera, Strain CCMP720" /LENGTH=77 /DNA_ID=CAMNT_0041897545 /DNA_START=23 /DNA_END=253 /DNA_ORIENTATION=-